MSDRGGRRFGRRAAAVEAWRLAVSSLDDDHPEKDWLDTADIHDYEHRREIEQTIDQHGPPALEDAFDDLREAFEDDW